MASNPASLTEETTLPDIDLTNPDSIYRCLHQHLYGAPNAWMRIQGTHTSQLERVVDFDLKIKGLNAQLLQVELGSIDNLKVFSTGNSDQNPSALDEETIKECCQAVIDLANTGSYKGIIVEQDTLEIDHIDIQNSVKGITKHVVYGGHIAVTFHDTTSLTTIQSQASQAQGNNISIKTRWVFEWPNLKLRSSNTSTNQQPQRRQETWSGRLKAAMVDNERGWIAKDDPIPAGIQFTRALNKYNLVDERIVESVHYENGVKVGHSGRMKFHMWGRDE